jgi:hypothetical protein
VFLFYPQRSEGIPITEQSTSGSSLYIKNSCIRGQNHDPRLSAKIRSKNSYPPQNDPKKRKGDDFSHRPGW